jgi:hypothetical protein
MIDYAAILLAHFPGTEWVVSGMDYEGITWLSDSPKPSQADLDKLWDKTQKAVDADQVKAARLARFQVEADPIFFQYQRGQATEKQWLDAVKKIETDLPLP